MCPLEAKNRRGDKNSPGDKERALMIVWRLLWWDMVEGSELSASGVSLSGEKPSKDYQGHFPRAEEVIACKGDHHYTSHALEHQHDNSCDVMAFVCASEEAPHRFNDRNGHIQRGTEEEDHQNATSKEFMLCIPKNLCHDSMHQFLESFHVCMPWCWNDDEHYQSTRSEAGSNAKHGHNNGNGCSMQPSVIYSSFCWFNVIGAISEDAIMTRAPHPLQMTLREIHRQNMNCSNTNMSFFFHEIR